VNLTGVIASFATGTYVVTRRGPTTVGSDGRADLATSSTFSILASVQPMSGRELQRLPEGMRVAERRVLFTATTLQVVGAPDVVRVDGEDWEVESVENWGPAIGSFCKATIAKVGQI
jgi:hypothetical protein